MTISRGRRRASWTLVTEANHYPSRLPNLPDATVVKLVTPRMAPSRIGEYLVELPAGGGTAEPVAPGFESFLYVLAGEASLAVDATHAPLGPGGFAYVPAQAAFALRAGAAGPARLLWVKRRYEPFGELAAPGLRTGHREDEPWAATGVPGFRRRELLPPGDPAFDFNMSLLAFDPGVGLDKVEVHDEEHGLYVTAGGGLYHLDGEDHPVQAGDFVYMAPYCPQSFTATGREPAEYLLYKDVFRDGF